MNALTLYKLNEDFLKEFPLETLKNMTLEKYTNTNRSDSFCYWLETKTRMLGGVGGGSSFKFGIYKCKEKPKEGNIKFRYDGAYAWRYSLGNTAEEAFKRVNEVLVQAALSGNEGNLDAIESISGNVIDSHIKWKIAFLYSKESIIPYYGHERLKYIGETMGMVNAMSASIADIQKFLLSKREGQDIHEFGKYLDDIYKNREMSNTNVWMWLGDDDSFIQKMLMAGDSVSDQLRDFEKYLSYETMREDIQKAVGNTDVSVPHAYWRFMKDVHIGDIVVVFKNKRVKNANHHVMYGWGIITSEFINDKQSAHPLQRSVEWKVKLNEPIETGVVKNTLFFHGTTEKQAVEIKRLLGIPDGKTVLSSKGKRYEEYIQLLEETHNLILTGAPGTGKTFMAQAIADEMGAETKFVQFHPSYDYTDFVEGLRPIEKDDGQMGFERRDGVFKEFCREAIRNLANSTKSVESLSKEMTWQEQLEQFVDNASETHKKFNTVNGSEFIITGMKGHSIVVRNEQNTVTTQLYVNVDKILELLTNEVSLKNVRDIRNYFKRQFGTQEDSYAFVITKAIRAMKKVMVVEANKIDLKPFVFIIDEINRGEASKIFGELFYAIDPGYRGKKDHLVQTQYQNLVPETDVFAKGFYVPENVYILATMNDIDRSVESMDFAMRRRFTWHEVTPYDTESMLDSLPCAGEAKERMHRLNNAIAETDGLGAAYMIGPSYFLKLGENGGDFEKLWKMNIYPLLKEYLRGFRKTEEILEKFSKAYFGKKNEIATDDIELIDEN